MFDRIRPQVTYWKIVFLFFGLGLFALSCTATSPAPQTDSATIEAMANKAESALVVAQTAEAKVNALEAEVKANSETAETALAEAEAARELAAAVNTNVEELLAPSPSTQPRVPLSGGVAITYEAPSNGGQVFYPVDGLLVSISYADFEDTIESLSKNKKLALALVDKTGQSQEWHLLHSESTRPVSDTAASFTEWSEYTIFAELPPGDVIETVMAEENKGIVSKLIFDESPRQKIVTTSSFLDGNTLEDNLFNFESALSDLLLSRDQIRKLLFVEEDEEGRITYTLVVIYPTAPSGTDAKNYWCTRVCSWRYCYWICR